MRLIAEFGQRIALALAVTPIWSKWYVPVSFHLYRYVIRGEATLSILWILHVSIRFPLGSDARKKQLKTFLPNRR